MPGCSVRTLPISFPRDVMLTMLVCATRWLSMHLYTLAYMFMLTCLSMLQHNEVMDILPKPTFVPRGHHLLFVFLLVCLLACLLAFLFLCLPSLSCFSALCLFYMPYASLSFHCLFVGFLFLPLHVHTWSEEIWS